MGAKTKVESGGDRLVFAGIRHNRALRRRDSKGLGASLIFGQLDHLTSTYGDERLGGSFGVLPFRIVAWRFGDFTYEGVLACNFRNVLLGKVFDTPRGSCWHGGNMVCLFRQATRLTMAARTRTSSWCTDKSPM